MPVHDNQGESRVAQLFRSRLERRMGKGSGNFEDLDSFGDSIGVARMGGQAPAPQQGAPAQVATLGASTARPAMPAAPAAAPAPTTTPVAPTAMPKTPAASTLGTAKTGHTDTGIPALDMLADMPRKQHRGYTHSRKLGRVLRPGG